MARELRRPLCEEGKTAFFKIIGADPIVYKTLKSVVTDSFVEAFSLGGALIALGMFVAMLITRQPNNLFYYLLPAITVILMGVFAGIGKRRERKFSRCVADINQTLREDVIVQVHSNPVGGMYENDSYWVMKEKGKQTEIFCDKLSEVAERAFGLIVSLSAAILMTVLNPFAAVPMLGLAFLRALRMFRLNSRYEDALDTLDAETVRYDETCDNLIRSAQTMEPDDVALSRAKAAAPVEEAQAVCVSLSNRLFSQTRIVPLIMLLAAGALSILVRASGLFSWYSPILIIPSLLMFALVLYNTSGYYSFNRSIADAEWSAIDLTTLSSTEE